MKYINRYLHKLFYVVSLACLLAVSIPAPSANAAFDPNLLMDDTVFNAQSMSAAQIDAFLNSFPSSCISANNGFSAPNVVGYNPSQGYLYGPNVSAGTVIFNAASAYDLNPQVILATLQKEQSLVSGGAGCYYHTPPTQNPCPEPPYGTYNECVTACPYAGGCVYIAMGYDCPYYCVPGSMGFSPQIIKATWKLKFVQQRSIGNYNWNVQKPGWDNSDDPPTPYSGYMTQGFYKRNSSSTAQQYDGYRPVNSNTTTVHLVTGASASLYSYTPFTSGNQSFVNRFEGWFGSTISSLYYSCRNGINIGSAPTGRKVVANRTGVTRDKLTLVIPNNNGSACIEAHSWADTNYQVWYSNIATNHPAVDPADSGFIAADTNGDGQDELTFVRYRNNGSGKIEIHKWDPSFQRWFENIATNHPAIDPADNKVIAADTNGDGRDELILVKYRNNGSGKIEVHTWLPGQQSWYNNIATNHPAIDPADNEVIAADTNGDGRDELILVKYRNNGSGRIEIHAWNPNQSQWVANIATNHPSVDPAYSQIASADDNGDRLDEIKLVRFDNTGSGKIEVHTWLPGLRSWYNNIATNHPQL